jgi:hypothetical protein
LTNLKRLGKKEHIALEVGNAQRIAFQLLRGVLVLPLILAAANQNVYGQILQQQTTSHSSFQIDRARRHRIGGGWYHGALYV